MDLLSNFDIRVDSNVFKLKKPLYGITQCPWAQFERFTCFMKKISFCQGQTYHTLFLKYSLRSKVIVSIVCIDVIILTGDNMVEMNHLNKCLAT